MKFKPVSDSSVVVSLVSLEDLVVPTHPYRKLLSTIDFSFLCVPLHGLYSDFGRPAYRVEQGFCALVLQWMEDLSDRELERYLQENIAGKYFCGFGLSDKTPDHSYFCELRKRIGTSGLGKLFTLLGQKLKEHGLVCEIFTFVDASQMISKVALWEERDRAIAQGIEKLNNEVVHQFAADPQARFGCKGKKKYWFGYKRHLSVCMKQGFITKTAATPANVTDAQGLKHVCPKGGMTIADKAYAVQEAQQTMKKNGCHSGAILKDNMREKDRRKDAFLTKIRMPFENVFSKMDKRVRYRGQAKVQFQAFIQAFVFNCKRLITLNAPPLFETSTG
jgi:transposase, IS5 family